MGDHGLIKDDPRTDTAIVRIGSQRVASAAHDGIGSSAPSSLWWDCVTLTTAWWWESCSRCGGKKASKKTLQATSRRTALSSRRRLKRIRS